jgi:hypothetical protein
MAYTQIQKIENLDPSPNNLWGIRSVVDGYHMFVQEEVGSRAEVYKRDIDGVWQNQGSVAGKDGLAAYGNYFIVIFPGFKRLRIFNKDVLSPNLQLFNAGADGTSTFGNSTAIGENYIVVGDQAKDTNTGQVFIYEKTGTDTWTAYANNPLQAIGLSTQDFFGSAVAVTDDSIIIGALGDNNKKGAVYIFQKDVDTGVWEQTQKIFASDGLANDQFGESISASEDHFVVGASLKDNSVGEVNAGAAYVFKYSTDWFEIDKLVSVDETSPEGDHFGESVYINGDYIIVGSPAARLNKGVADIFYKKRSWGHLKKILGSDTAADDDFGTSVSISGRFITVGSPDNESATTGGSVYIYEDPQVNLRLAQEFEVNSEYLPTKASVYLKRVGENTSNFWAIYNTQKTVIDATNFSTITGLTALTELSPISQYKMNDNLATKNVVDSQGFSDGTNLANTDTKDTTGKINGALQFNGLAGNLGGDYIDTNNSFQSTFKNSFSINFWHKMSDGEPAGTMNFFGHNNADISFISLAYSTGDISFQYQSNTNTQIVIVTNPYADGQETWHMLTVTVNEDDAANVTIKLYNDGVEIATQTGFVIMNDYDQTDNLTIGTEKVGSTDLNFGGDMDNFCIFEKTLTQDDIDFLYNNGNGTEALSGNINEIIFEDTVGGFTGNGYMIVTQAPPSFSDYKTLNYPIRAITPDTYNLWMRVINISSNSLEMEVLIDGNVSKTISTLIDNPSDGLEWSWVSTTLVLPDNRDHTLGIRIKGNNTAIDKIYIDDSTDTPYTEGPDLSDAPYLTAHMKVYDSLKGEPNSPIPVYDYKNSITEIIQDDWYNFNINALATNQGYTTASDFHESFYLVMSVSGSNTSNFIVWELVDNDEYNAPSSAIKF